MNINKTADECIVEIGIALLQCLGDARLSLAEKQDATKWVIAFLDYQDALNEKNCRKITLSQQKLNKIFCPNYYKNALQEFKNANILYQNIHDLNKLNGAINDYATSQTIIEINSFCDAFLNTIKKYEPLIKDYSLLITKAFIVNFNLLTFTIHYHISYSFINELKTTVETLIKILKLQIKENSFDHKNKSTTSLMSIIMKENEIFFDNIKKINLINFINQLEEIFNYQNSNKSKKILSLVFKKPKRLVITMNTILKKHNIDLYDEIWNYEKINHKKSNIIMNLFAFETYFLQGYGHHQIYENLILKKVIDDEKYWFIFQEYKNKNKINKNANVNNKNLV